MEPITLRLPEDMADDLDEEAEEHGFSSRSEYVRHILRNRSGTDPTTRPYSDRTQTDYDELEERLNAVEAAVFEPNTPDPDPTTDSSLEERAEAAVEAVADGWGDTDERLQQRIAAATAVLTHAVRTGAAVGKSDAIDDFHDQYPVDGQSKETWWRKNVREVLQEFGTYSNGAHGYRVELDDLAESV